MRGLKERREENITEGRAALESEFKRNYINLPDEQMTAFIANIAARQHFESVDDFYAAIGYGGVVLSKLMQRIKDDYQKMNRPVETLTPEQMIEKSKKNLQTA